MTLFRVAHETTYLYGSTVVVSHNKACLKPRQLGRQAVLEFQIEILPTPDTVAWRSDYFGNDVVHFALERPHTQLRLRATSTIDVRRPSAPPAGSSLPWEAVVSGVGTPGSRQHLEALPFVLDSTLVHASSGLEAYAAASFTPERPILDAVLDLNSRIYNDFEYDETATHVATPIADVFRDRRGVCQDFAHLMIGCLRSLGIPARYISGYVPTSSTLEVSEAGDTSVSLVGGHASHAWVAVFCGSLGWREVDPTNNTLVHDEHILLGWGRDYDDVCPVRGVTVGGSGSVAVVEVRVEQLN